VDFAAVAAGCGALGLSVGADEEFEPALRQALESGRPALLHLTVDPRWTTAGGDLADVVVEAPEAWVEPEADPAAEPALPPEPILALEPDPALEAHVAADADTPPVADVHEPEASPE
jgi:hypothetical protein